MARKVIKIDSYIGSWGYSKQLLKYDLNDTQKDGVVIEIASLGGDLYHAIDMHNQIAQHGNVEVVFTGPSASAATILAMGAKKVSIIDNSFFLIHKVMAVVDNWGMFNEEELDKLIQDLKTLRSENLKFDQAIARIYQRKTGMAINDILSEMKKDTWMTAQEAKDLGFVDEIMEPTTQYNYLSERFVAMVRGAELPEIPQAAAFGSAQAAGDDSSNGNVKTSRAASHSLEISKNIDMRQLQNLNQLLDVEELQATEEGCYLNEEQLDAIENRLSVITSIEEELQEQVNSANVLLETANEERENLNLQLGKSGETIESMTAAHTEEVSGLQAQVTEATEQSQRLTSELEASQSQFADFALLIDGLDETVASAPSHAEKVAAIRTLLSKAPGAHIPGALRTNQEKKKDGVNWDVINKLPHNVEADQCI